MPDGPELILFRIRIALNQLVTVLLALFVCCLLTECRKSLQKLRYLFLIVGSTERLNQVVNGCLILGIDLDCFSALFGSFSILSVLEI